MLLIPSLWAEVYRYPVLYARDLYQPIALIFVLFYIAFAALFVSISRYASIHLFVVCQPTSWQRGEALFAFAPRSLRCSFDIFDT